MGSLFTKEVGQHRTIFFQRQNNKQLPNNQVQTTKYTWYSFLPKAILLQFIRPANLVYLISAVLQSINVISSLSPVTAIAPFVFVIGISLIREGYEDYKRYKKDMQINERIAHHLVNGEFVDIKWEQIYVGDIIKVKNNETIPADFLLLYTSQENSLCFVQTANLDGQSNLKTKFAYIQTSNIPPNQYNKLKGKIIADLPNSNLHQFSGLFILQEHSQKTIDFDNFMLRQTVVKNTQQVVGVVVYTGYDTKIVKNQGHAQNKVSQVQRKVNIIQGILLLTLIILSMTCTIGFASYHYIRNQRQYLNHLAAQVSNRQLQVALIYFSSFLLLTFLIPISLNVSIQVIKGFLGIFLGFDDKMYYKPIQKGCSVNNVTILEQLGQVDYVLTDKTGTLTANQMVFKYLSVADKCYSSEQILQNVFSLSNNKDFYNFWLGLIICHDVVYQPQNRQYQGSSPDEVCFITFSKSIGYQFNNRTKTKIILNVFDSNLEYQLLEILPFDIRKRMSVIVRDQKSNKIFIYTKGADSCIFSNALPSPYDQNIKDSITRFAKQGYRTLLFSYRQILAQQYSKLCFLKNQLKLAKTKKLKQKYDIEKQQALIVEKLQSNLIILGATAIEDRLQDQVPQTIARLEQAGIVVMMITGDKLQTAQNIGYLANFIKQDSKVFRFQAGIPTKEIINIMNLILSQKQIKNSPQISIIIQGSTIANFLNLQNKNCAKLLSIVNSVIFCRSSPKQKGMIVEYVKQKLNGITLAIGDGGNDVSMIQIANIGVGILGKQGNSASTASDFSIGQFKYLDRLLLHHGRWFYYRLSYFFVFYGWKNLIMAMLLYFFMIDSAFSAAAGLSQPFITLYNIIIGLVLVVYYAVFEQDINDDQYRPAYKKLPIFYKQIKKLDLFSYKRYILWTFFAIIITVFIYCTTRYGLGTYYAIDKQGHVGSFSHHSQILAISLSIIVIMILISDIKTYTFILAILIIGIITIIGTILFFILQSYVKIGRGTSYMILSMSTLRFWLVIFVNVMVVYAGKQIIDTTYYQSGETQVDKTIRQKKLNQQQGRYAKVAPNSSITQVKIQFPLKMQLSSDNN